MQEGEIAQEFRICSNVEVRNGAGDSNSLECERKKSHGNTQICLNVGVRDRA